MTKEKRIIEGMGRRCLLIPSSYPAEQVTTLGTTSLGDGRHSLMSWLLPMVTWHAGIHLT